MASPAEGPGTIEVRGARVHNLRNVNVSVPLGQLVSVAGVSGSGKSSLALGVLYAEGSRRYLEALSAYTRRRLTQAARPLVDSIEHVPAALALRQRPPVPGVRSTFGTSTELLNSLRLVFSRLGGHECPNGHRLAPTIDVALDQHLTCPVCGAVFPPPSAESFSFNSAGACPTCAGTGTVRDVDDGTLVPDESLSIDEGAVTPWSLFGLAGNSQAAAEMGVRTDVPFRDLDERERTIVFHGPPEKRRILYPAKNGKLFELNMTYRNAHDAVEQALRKAETEKGLRRIDRFLSVQTCPDCHGTRLSARARSTLVDGISLASATAKSLDEVTAWAATIPATMPPAMTAMARSIVTQLVDAAQLLIRLGLGYLTLDRASATLSTGERQRVQLSRSVRSRTTGVLYVLDEPSIGLHPSNIDGLLAVVRTLLADRNSVVIVDHDVQLLREADWLIEIGPGSGARGGEVVVSAPLAAAVEAPQSRIAGFITGAEKIRVRTPPAPGDTFSRGHLQLATRPLHTVQALDVDVPQGRLVLVTGVSGSGKTTMVLESLVPALIAKLKGEALPAHVASLKAAGIDRVSMVDATPVGTNVRSTVATYSGAFDDLRRAYAQTPEAKARGLKAGTSPTTPAPCAVPPATGPARSPSTCSSCRTWTSSAPTATAAGTHRRRTGSAAVRGTGHGSSQGRRPGNPR
ncbi:excinuclease ABC subunit UvrA [Arthrobacter sp. ATA002]|uniref:excinuclease ABC subunit UvrA n=1 Tax=Arthrobacter sp. ATA002 TaxID=2991715 RepID=UPI0022A71084|nr:excinuclease ABC subunit UvrA [Arthrobacter sp. ATA002]WAP50576.1 excinuclease ABC subunit UvrA [Arthrobacter sp. ATA002]